jgi:hypothetical protein
MPFFVLIMLLKAIYEALRVFRERNRAMKPKPLCVGCLHAHVQYAIDARRAISCTYGGAVRPMKLDVLYCTDYETRNAPTRTRVVGFVREKVPAE